MAVPSTKSINGVMTALATDRDVRRLLEEILLEVQRLRARVMSGEVQDDR